jgi:hypothetical protein
VVHAAPPKGEVPVRNAREVKYVGGLELPLVAVCRAEHRQDPFAARYGRALYLYVLARVALGRHLDWRSVTQQLLDRRFCERRFAHEPLHLLGMLEEGERAAGDQVNGGLVAGHQE